MAEDRVRPIIVKKIKIILRDEATANIDIKTEEMIQSTALLISLFLLYLFGSTLAMFDAPYIRAPLLIQFSSLCRVAHKKLFLIYQIYTAS